jgi:hypothetical protein
MSTRSQKLVIRMEPKLKIGIPCTAEATSNGGLFVPGGLTLKCTTTGKIERPWRN